MLKIYNTLTRQKEEFNPIHPGKVGMYVCGVTIYDHCHIGHGRTFVAFDVVARYLRYAGYDLTYVRNITDVDDKIIKRAAETRVTCDELTERLIGDMHADFDALGMVRPDIEPRATQHIEEIIELVQSLLEKEHAYVADNGDVMFIVESYADYGKLSGQDLEQLQAGARVDVVDAKRNPLDFVLWKMSKPGEPTWESPWGPGRPGWHIECSAMNSKHLGNHFDIHGGGSDLQFPHHENEIAQSCCAHGGDYVKYWMHSGMVMVDKEKMSKSLGNFFTIRDVLAHYDAETVRYFLMSGHYRSQLNYSEDNLKQARAALERMYTALQKAGVNKTFSLWEGKYDVVSVLCKAACHGGQLYEASIDKIADIYDFGIHACAHLREFKSHFVANSWVNNGNVNSKEKFSSLIAIVKEVLIISYFEKYDVNSTVMAVDYIKSFRGAMDDDFNTPEAYSALFALVSIVNTSYDRRLKKVWAELLKHLAGVLGLLNTHPSKFLQGDRNNREQSIIERLIAERNQARADKNWAAADAARNRLTEMGIVLEDSAGKTSWRRA